MFEVTSKRFQINQRADAIKRSLHRLGLPATGAVYSDSTPQQANTLG